MTCFESTISIVERYISSNTLHQMYSFPIPSFLSTFWQPHMLFLSQFSRQYFPSFLVFCSSPQCICTLINWRMIEWRISTTRVIAAPYQFTFVCLFVRFQLIVSYSVRHKTRHKIILNIRCASKK